MKERKNIALYLDLENMRKNINLKELMDAIKLEYSKDEIPANFVIKYACGNDQTIPNYREQLSELNFDIREATHVAKNKNRADLLIVIHAFEQLHLDNPKIDLFAFLTKDSDFSIIMDILRKYGKDVWLITEEKDSRRDIFQNSADNIILINDYIKKTTTTKKSSSKKVESEKPDSKEKTVLLAMKKVLSSFKSEEVISIQSTNTKFAQVEKSITMNKTIYKTFKGLYKFLHEQGVIDYQTKRNQKGKTGTVEIKDLSIIDKLTM